jgi:hypothetical protein
VQQAGLADGGTIKIGTTTMTVRFVPEESGQRPSGLGWGGSGV